MSERNFCRVFKREVSLTVFEYIHKIRKEKITTLIESTDFSKRQIANKVGLESERQLRRILSK
jgi:transcriptional regulator GlxA family with amidase domain